MKMKSIFTTLLFVFAVALTGCSTMQRWVYRIDVPQGNYLEAAQVNQVKAGMTYAQVQYLLGTPMLIDPYSSKVLYYVFLEQKSYERPEQHTFIVYLNDNNIVTEVHLDKPLPNSNQILDNNEVITVQAPEQSTSHWWKFW